jgi:predicted O-methyltransferase YrrM
MSGESINLTPALYAYLQKVSLREPDVLKKLREETHKLSNYNMQISPEQGQFMALLMELMGGKKTLDIGTFTGYSALAVALAIPSQGKVITCDVSEEWTTIAKKYWQLAGVENKVQLKVAPALETLQQLLDEGEAESFDFAFIDADKLNYSNYYEKSLALLRRGGLIAVDNVLWDGQVADEHYQDESTKAIRALNEKICHDERVSVSMIPIGDGLTLARKR